jgi:hypothetical protein
MPPGNVANMTQRASRRERSFRKGMYGLIQRTVCAVKFDVMICQGISCLACIDTSIDQSKFLSLASVFTQQVHNFSWSGCWMRRVCQLGKSFFLLHLDTRDAR